VLIIRRSKLYYTASGIITPVGGRPVHDNRCVLLCTPCVRARGTEKHMLMFLVRKSFTKFMFSNSVQSNSKSSTVCPCNMIDIFIITNTMHMIRVDKITLFKTT
jgi:hypothetical protein